MRRTLFPLAILLLLVGCHPPGRSPLTHHESRTFAAGSGKVVRCDLRSLDLEVDVKEGDSITAVVDLEVSASSPGLARRWIENHTPTFTDSGETLEVGVPDRHRSYLVLGQLRTRGTLAITLPPQCKLEVDSSSGDITIEGRTALSGPARLTTSSGDVEISGGVGELIMHTSSGDSIIEGRTALSGPARLTTSSGDVEISGGVGELIMHTSSGDLQVDHMSLARLEFVSSSGDARVRDGCGDVLVDTSSGEIRLHDLRGNLSVDTHSGDVVASWISIPRGPLHVRTASGDVDLDLPAGATFRGEVATSSGELRSDFPATTDRRGRHLTLDGGSGAIEAEIRTTSGDVHLRKGSEPAATPSSPATPESPAEHKVEL